MIPLLSLCCPIMSMAAGVQRRTLTLPCYHGVLPNYPFLGDFCPRRVLISNLTMTTTAATTAAIEVNPQTCTLLLAAHFAGWDCPEASEGAARAPLETLRCRLVPPSNPKLIHTAWKYRYIAFSPA